MTVIHITPRLRARTLYWQGYCINDIAKHLAVSAKTIGTWKRRDEWDQAPIAIKVGQAADVRLNQLIAKSEKSEADYKEIETLGKLLERTARIEKYTKTHNEADLNSNIKKRHKNKSKLKNYLSDEQIDALIKNFEESLFTYQQQWYDALQHFRIRNILKSRQIGATWYFAREALIDALINGHNQIFLSASKSQAHVFKQYIIAFVREVTEIELKGDPIILANGATLYFLGTNVNTAQGYHGNIIMDEYFWIGQFEEFRKVASGMAMHKKWKQTYISTPSTLDHPAYSFWSGERFNKHKKK